jgi:hypothetical protein
VAPPPEPTPEPTPEPEPTPAPAAEAEEKAVAPKAEAPAAAAPPPLPPPLPPEEWWARALGTRRAPLTVAPLPVVPKWSGSITLRGRGRYTGDDSDNDLYQYFRVRYRREDVAGWSGSMHLRISEDLEGDGSNGSFYVFDSVDDTYESPVISRLYHLYANHRWASGPVEQVRIGRQDVTAGDLFHVDGVHALFRPSDCSTVRLYAFAGVPTHLYESSIDGDWIVGAGATFDPWRGATVEVSDVYLEDESGIYGTPTANLATIQLSQRLREWGNLHLGYQHLDEHPRVAWGSLDVFAPRWDATFRGAFRSQLHSEKEEAYDIDPYYAILLDLEPYWEATLSASKGLGRIWSIEAGGQVRRLYDEDDQGDFNHDFTRAYATLAARDWPRCGWGVALTGEWWHTEDDEDVAAAGFEVDWRPSPRWRASAGLDYALYRTDVYAAEERYDSWGWFVRARYRPSPRWEYSGSVRLETDDFDEYLTVDLAARWEF